MPLNDKEQADLAAALIACIPEYPRKAIESRCGIKMVFDPDAAGLRECAIDVANGLLCSHCEDDSSALVPA